jgi:hypothetical protein
MIVYKSCAAAGGDKEKKLAHRTGLTAMLHPHVLSCAKGNIVWSCSLDYQLGGTREQAFQETKSCQRVLRARKGSRLRAGPH